MDGASDTDTCILLVDADPSCIRNTLALLLQAEFRVVTACRGEDALCTLEKKKREVHMVLTRTNLPDMCAFELVKILDSKFQIPVVMICDFNHQPTIQRGLLNGATYCLSMPLCLEDIENLWQHPIIKKNFLKRKTCEPPISGSSSQGCKRMIKELEKVEVPSVGQSSSFTWTPYLYYKFLEVVWHLGIYDAAPSEILRYLNVPGLTSKCIVEKLEEFHKSLRRQQELQIETILVTTNPPHIAKRLMDEDMYSIPSLAYALQQPPPIIECLEDLDSDDELDSNLFKWPITAEDYANLPGLEEMEVELALSRVIPNLPFNFPNTSQLAPPPVPPANTAQMSTQAANVAPPPNKAPPVPDRGEDKREHGDQVRSQPAWFLLPGDSYPSASRKV